MVLFPVPKPILVLEEGVGLTAAQGFSCFGLTPAPLGRPSPAGQAGGAVGVGLACAIIALLSLQMWESVPWDWSQETAPSCVLSGTARGWRAGWPAPRLQGRLESLETAFIKGPGGSVGDSLGSLPLPAGPAWSGFRPFCAGAWEGERPRLSLHSAVGRPSGAARVVLGCYPGRGTWSVLVYLSEV